MVLYISMSTVPRGTVWCFRMFFCFCYMSFVLFCVFSLYHIHFTFFSVYHMCFDSICLFQIHFTCYFFKLSSIQLNKYDALICCFTRIYSFLDLPICKPGEAMHLITVSWEAGPGTTHMSALEICM
jgi:hypothetical protein